MDRIEIICGDITLLAVDAIVNAANTNLVGGGGVDGAIHRAAGTELSDECIKLEGCPTGYAKITKGYRLPAPYIIHAVGPVWQGGRANEAKLLASCYRESLKLAVEFELETVAFPAISCGAYGYPLEEAAEIAIRSVGEYLDTNYSLKKVYLVCFSEKVMKVYDSLKTRMSMANE